MNAAPCEARSAPFCQGTRDLGAIWIAEVAAELDAERFAAAGSTITFGSCPSPALAIWIYNATPSACQTRSVYRPCECGHGMRVHRDDDGCWAEHCPCSWWRYPQPAVSTDLSLRASCSDVCTCGGEHHEGASYYVTAVRGPEDVKRPSFVLGPFEHHPLALSMVETGRRLAEMVDDRASFYAFGTVAVTGEERPVGQLNFMLEAEEDEATVEALYERSTSQLKTRPLRRRSPK